MRSRRALIIFTLLALVGSSLLWAQSRSGRRGGRRSQESFSARGAVPEWKIDPKFKTDVFTFARVEYTSSGGYGWRSKWTTDYPDSDLNFSYRLQQVTSLKVDPNGKIVKLTDPELFDFPFIYIVEPGDMSLTEEEVDGLRRYLLNGGFLMVDDFWGEYEWNVFYHEIKRVFPDREPVELPMEHPIFHTVFPLKLTKQELQIPNVRTGTYSQYTGQTWEGDGRDVHLRGIFDDNGRMMAIICHNTDNGDGWEEEGTDPYYFREFSEKKAYPLGINIVFYAMTH
ncbi:MAG: DUF4159 domain-containing protein [Verrucomicrobia bacterium]|nr:DUF4159 domain-containing protein [Verrucomicrobiota bacterium]